jgi:hypothetical protein
MLYPVQPAVLTAIYTIILALGKNYYAVLGTARYFYCHTHYNISIILATSKITMLYSVQPAVFAAIHTIILVTSKNFYAVPGTARYFTGMHNIILAVRKPNFFY